MVKIFRKTVLLLLSQNNLFAFDHVNYQNFLKLLKHHPLKDIRLYLDAVSFICVYSVMIYCSTLLHITGIRDFLVILETPF
jgi:hypothetical protein